MRGYLIWDFDDTLAFNKKRWAGVLHELVLRELPDYSATVEDIRRYMQSGFYWHTPEIGHAHIENRDQWWEGIYPQLELALASNHVELEIAKKLTREFPEAYLELSNWSLFDDTLSTLRQLSERGWQHLILSNHVPELESLVTVLGLSGHVEKIFNSALIGYEKPHPEMFRCVLEYVNGAKTWMIGDNLNADVRGAERAGIPAILVRKFQDKALHFCPNLTSLLKVI
ncbi:MAG: HAD family hydrolase [Trueperaceae bacterium]